MPEPTKPDAPDETQEPRRWYSIPEAAEYLGVSEPTIFRWMKNSQLSFYKVGGSTRFTREGLDAAIEKTTGQWEAEAASGRCTSCGHTVLIEGRIQTAGRVYFYPEKTRFWTFQQSAVATSANNERFRVLGGVRVGHLFDARNGLPSDGRLGASVQAATGTESDVLSTVAFLLGPSHFAAARPLAPSTWSSTAAASRSSAKASGQQPSTAAEASRAGRRFTSASTKPE